MLEEKENTLLADHTCTKNHTGSSPAMEVEGIKRIFNRSVTKRNIRITGYVWDGDTKAYCKVVEEQPYGEEFEIKKYDCVGHVQKCVGSNLRKLKAKSGKKSLVMVKP